MDLIFQGKVQVRRYTCYHTLASDKCSGIWWIRVSSTLDTQSVAQLAARLCCKRARTPDLPSSSPRLPPRPCNNTSSAPQPRLTRSERLKQPPVRTYLDGVSWTAWRVALDRDALHGKDECVCPEFIGSTQSKMGGRMRLGMSKDTILVALTLDSRGTRPVLLGLDDRFIITYFSGTECPIPCLTTTSQLQ